MTPEDQPRFIAVLNGLAAVKPGGKLTPEALDVWWLAMRQWPLAEFEAAAAHLTLTVEFMPNPYHFEQLRKAAGAEAAGDAWAAVVQVNRYGRTGRESLLTPRIERIVAAMGGWSALAMVKTEDLPFREHRFRELWDEFTETDEARAALPSARSTVRITGPRSIAALLTVREVS